MLFIYIQTGWAWTRIQISVTPKKVMRVGEPNKTGDGLARSTSNSWTVSLKVIQDSRFSEKTGSALKASSRPAQARRSGHTPRSSSISSIGNMRTSAIRAIRKILSHMSTISVGFTFERWSHRDHRLIFLFLWLIQMRKTQATSKDNSTCDRNIGKKPGKSILAVSILLAQRWNSNRATKTARRRPTKSAISSPQPLLLPSRDHFSSRAIPSAVRSTPTCT